MTVIVARSSSSPQSRAAISCLLALLCFVSSVTAAADEPERFGIGRPATAEEIAAWDIDIMPDGTGLPAGSGNVAEGEVIYAAKCAVCHGKTGVEGPNDRLIVYSKDEPFPDAADADTWQHRIIGNYWPYATTLFDYIRRSMPQNLPGSLTDDEVYALSAFLLHRNHLLPDDATLDAESLAAIVMPGRDRFTPDDRQEHNEVH